ncbi:MAG TPA: PEP-CTERM sorting domain-containing protein [Burkholderiaceae bacterium]|jgi:hypothetical protein
MKNLTTCLCAAALALASFAANATTFDFSYSFDTNNVSDGNPLVLTGSFTGTQSGNLITDVTGVQLFLNGTAFSGPLLLEGFNNVTSNWDTKTAAVISTDAGLSNFAIADADETLNPNGVTNFFRLSGGEALVVTTNIGGADGSNFLAGDESAVNAKWTVTASAVPEPSTYALLLAGLGSIGLLVQRRRSV